MLPNSNMVSPYVPICNIFVWFVTASLHLRNVCYYAFQKGVCDKKMLEKLAICNIQDVRELLSLVENYAQVAQGRESHAPYETQPGIPSAGFEH